jgi:OOP family OmpA-OmpF porin
MKKFFLLIFVIGLISTCFSQNDYKKPPAFGFNFVYNDFKAAADIRARGLASVLRSKDLFRTGRMDVGLSINYLAGLNNHVDFIAILSGASLDYPSRNLNSPDLGSGNLLLETTAGLNLKLLSDNYFITPFINLGVGASAYNGYFAAIAPIGAGLQVSIGRTAYFLVNSQYRLPVTQNATYHFFHSIGVAGNLRDPKVEAPKTIELPVVEDRDGDGLVDSADACPDIAGPASLNGCPDRDNDAIADRNDSCPDVAGLAKYQGCPVPDKDNDGINDEEDKCTDVAGVARYQGCPIPDTDKDGVNDEEDKCPNEVGLTTNFGCPEIKQEIIEKVNLAAKNIFFATGSAKLLAKSYASLDNVVKILQDNPSINATVEGHTDISGTAAKNQVLSENRAASVKAYFISKGIDESRITSAGFGINKPIADNKTVAGRAKNRRVEIRLNNH